MSIEMEDFVFLKWPEDKAIMKRLNSSELIFWYASQDPKYILYIGQDAEFKRFWYWKYLMPLKIKRTLYSLTKFLRR